jgi:hypothetical protein
VPTSTFNSWPTRDMPRGDDSRAIRRCDPTVGHTAISAPSYCSSVETVFTIDLCYESDGDGKGLWAG